MDLTQRLGVGHHLNQACRPFCRSGPLHTAMSFTTWWSMGAASPLTGWDNFESDDLQIQPFLLPELIHKLHQLASKKRSTHPSTMPWAFTHRRHKRNPNPTPPGSIHTCMTMAS
jgi:hypothetical protein